MEVLLLLCTSMLGYENGLGFHTKISLGYEFIIERSKIIFFSLLYFYGIMKEVDRRPYNLVFGVFSIHPKNPKIRKVCKKYIYAFPKGFSKLNLNVSKKMTNLSFFEKK